MGRVQVQLSDDAIRLLQERSKESGRPVAAIVRDAVHGWIASDERRRLRQRAIAATGAFRSGLGDLAERHDAYLDQADK